MATKLQQVPAVPPKVSSEDIISQKTDLCISNAIVKTGIGFSAGVVLSVLLFRRRAFPVWLGTGFGLGSGWTDCERSFNPVAVPGVRVLNSTSGIEKTQPSVMERLSAKTSTLVDKTRDQAQVALGQGKEKAGEAMDKAKDKAGDVKGKENEIRAKHTSFLPLGRSIDLDDGYDNNTPESGPQHPLAGQSRLPGSDCTACRLTGFATLMGLSAYSFREAYLMGFFTRRRADGTVVAVPRVRSIGGGRIHGALLVMFGLGSAAAGAYRLVN